MTISVAWFDHFKDATPQMEVTTWDSFATKLEAMSQTEREISEKQRSPLVSPAIYKAGDIRRNHNVQGFAGWFAIDIDDAGCTLQDATDLCVTAGISHVIWTTTSHTDDAHRFRVAFPLDRDVVPDEMARFWAGTHAFFKGWGDIKTKDPARMMIAPAKWRGSGAQFIRRDDLQTMCVDQVLAMASTLPTQVSAPVMKHRATSAPSSAPTHERQKAQLAISKWKLGTLRKADLQGIKAEHLLPAATQISNHGRYGSKLAAAKKTLERLQRAAK